MKRLVGILLLQLVLYSCHGQVVNMAGITFVTKRVATGRNPESVVAADVNGDKYLDLLVANADDNNVSVLLGDGKGGMMLATNSPFGAGENPSDIAVADFNHDDRLDLAVANHDTNHLTILLGNGHGQFSPAPQPSVTVKSKPHPHGIAAADFNDDGWPDLATDDWQNNNVTIVLNDGSGRFMSPGLSFSVGRMPYHKLRSADVNGDGKPDVITTNFEGGNITVLLGNGKGGFNQPPGSPFVANAKPFGVAIGDVNGDGRLDLAVAHYSGHINDSSSDRVSILLGTGDGAFKPGWSQLVPGRAPTGAAIGDINGDGIADVAFVNYAAASVTLVLGTKGEFQISPLVVAVGQLPSSVAMGDLNGDGKADIITASSGDNDITIALAK
ncbi:MAG: FG-GAP repeat domain-containing protein [Pyrinomonadaceae bacterium]